MIELSPIHDVIRNKKYHMRLLMGMRERQIQDEKFSLKQIYKLLGYKFLLHSSTLRLSDI